MCGAQSPQPSSNPELKFDTSGQQNVGQAPQKVQIHQVRSPVGVLSDTHDPRLNAKTASRTHEGHYEFNVKVLASQIPRPLFNPSESHNQTPHLHI